MMNEIISKREKYEQLALIGREFSTSDVRAVLNGDECNTRALLLNVIDTESIRLAIRSVINKAIFKAELEALEEAETFTSK